MDNEACKTVRRDLGHNPVASGFLGGENSLFIERYILQFNEISVSEIPCAALLVQFGGSKAVELSDKMARNTYLPTDSVIIPKNVPTKWRFSGSVDFGCFYVIPGCGDINRRIERFLDGKEAPIPINDSLIGALAVKLVDALNLDQVANRDYLERLSNLMQEHTYNVISKISCPLPKIPHGQLSRLQKIINFVRENPQKDLTPKYLAEKIGISLPHFYRVFLQCTGMTPHAYIVNVRLERACKLLSESELPIAWIAEELRFSSQSHFTAVFHKRYLVTPARYRAKFKTPRNVKNTSKEIDS